MPAVAETLEDRARARVGKTLCSKWRLDSVLGVGGVAAVYAARHRNGRRVAVKVLHPELAVDASMRRRFLREGYVANRVEHTGAVVVLDDAVDDDGTVLLVMELLEGETLESRCRRHDGKLPITEAIIIANGLLGVLESAHENGILHRDVTPANVFVTRKGEIKLLDFGIARLREPESTERTMSVPGALGTPAFMPPEQARGLWEELDARSDLWAVGAVLFRIISGRSVHKGRTPSELLLSAMTKRAPALSSVVEEVPAAIASVVDRALLVDPKKRWQNAADFRAALAEAYLELEIGPLSKAAPLEVPIVEPDPRAEAARTAGGFGTTVRETGARSRRRWLVVASVFALGLCGGGYLVSNGQSVAPALMRPAPALAVHYVMPTPAPAPPREPEVKAPEPTAPVARTVKATPTTKPATSGEPKPKRPPSLEADNPLFDIRNE